MYGNSLKFAITLVKTRLLKLAFTLCRSLFVREKGKLETYTVLLLGASPPLISSHVRSVNLVTSQFQLMLTVKLFWQVLERAKNKSCLFIITML